MKAVPVKVLRNCAFHPPPRVHLTTTPQLAIAFSEIPAWRTQSQSDNTPMMRRLNLGQPPSFQHPRCQYHLKYTYWYFLLVFRATPVDQYQREAEIAGYPPIATHEWCLGTNGAKNSRRAISYHAVPSRSKLPENDFLI
jgi:hypothetical protein